MTELTKKLEEIFGKEVLEEIENGKNPSVEIVRRTLSNAFFDEKSGLIRLGTKKEKRSFLSLGQAKKFMQTLLVAAQLKKNLEENQPAIGTRQLFYLLKHTIPGTNENTFDDQKTETDPIVEDIEVTLNVLREQLGLFAVPDGYIVGPMVVYDRKTEDTLDYTKMGLGGGAIPALVEDDYYNIKEISAKYILVVEKYQVWQLLNQEKFWKKHNCLLMTGKGQSARAPRRLLARLNREFNLPVYIFTDLDPWGYYIYSVYKQGSIKLAHFSEKAGVPASKFIGLSTRDIEKYDIQKSNWIKLNQLDYKRIKEIKNYPWFKKKEWQNELVRLEKFGYKVESDSLVAKKIDFTANVYLPEKIETKDFLP
ncbi:MAG: DNA topoisomerase [Candidatus Aenigmarchaeota archaeon ex4484_56]|nr:MAG: DNA topoisomerase [Candidatus Aenigmarchaeota archaeon ex4484_56]